MTRAELYASAKENGALVDLSGRAKWRVTGADRVRFLNGQLSNDVRKLKPDEAIHACVLTAKGKLCGDVFVSTGPDHLLIDAEPGLRESLAARLERYIIADDVTLEDVTEEFRLIHVMLPPGAHSASWDENGAACFAKARRFQFEHESNDFFMRSQSFESVWNQFARQFQPIDTEMAETLRIEAGVPRWGAELDENILPQEARLERDAIDFHKGCYVGQEVISRIKSVGHVNRSLRGFVSDAPLLAGMELFAPGGSAEKPIGYLTSAAWSFGLEKWAALGYLKRGVGSEILEARAADGSATASAAVKDLPLIPF